MFQKACGNPSQCFALYGCLKRGAKSLEYDGRSGSPSKRDTIGNVEEIHQLAHEDHRRAITDIVVVGGLLYGAVQAILTSSLSMQLASVKIALQPSADHSSERISRQSLVRSPSGSRR